MAHDGGTILFTIDFQQWLGRGDFNTPLAMSTRKFIHWHMMSQLDTKDSTSSRLASSGVASILPEPVQSNSEICSSLPNLSIVSTPSEV